MSGVPWWVGAILIVAILPAGAKILIWCTHGLWEMFMDFYVRWWWKK